MDTFWSEMTNLGAIVRTLILGLLMIFITKGVNRYLSYRSVKSIQRQLKGMEYQKTFTENLAKSERLALLYSFQMLFSLMVLASVAFMLPSFYAILKGKDDAFNAINLLIWALFCAGPFGVSQLLNRVEKYPESIEGFNKKITALTTKLSNLGSKS
jgi:hypothetical protein